MENAQVMDPRGHPPDCLLTSDSLLPTHGRPQTLQLPSPMKKFESPDFLPEAKKFWPGNWVKKDLFVATLTTKLFHVQLHSGGGGWIASWWPVGKGPDQSPVPPMKAGTIEDALVNLRLSLKKWNQALTDFLE